MDYEEPGQLIAARMAGDLLVPECLPDVADPLSGVYLPFHHYHDSNLTLVALRTNSDSGAIEGMVDGVFPFFVHPKFPGRIGGARNYHLAKIPYRRPFP